jgi:hypothetical protein
MNISDTFYIALCMTVLIIGVVYWFWTQTQHLQRKINLLENIVYEFKASVSSVSSMSSASSSGAAPEAPLPSYEPPSDEDDSLHEDLHSDLSPVEESSSGTVEPVANSVAGATVSLSDDLQPGGVGSGLDELMTPDSKIKPSALEAMTLKELRRLAEQRNVANASTLRKQALIEALRGDVKVPAPADDAVPVFEPSRIELQ